MFFRETQSISFIFLKEINWTCLINHSKKQLCENVKIKSFRKLLENQKEYYDGLCSTSGIHCLEIKHLRELKISIGKIKAKGVFIKKDQWLNLIDYIVENFDKIEKQRAFLKDNLLI